MKIDVWEKIEWVRAQPEHIRMRYVFICLTVSMLFVIGVWLLSLKESFQNISRDVSSTAEKGKEQLPDVKIPSLNNLLEQSAPLGANKKDEKTGQEYFEGQFRPQSARTENGVGGNAPEAPTPAP